MYDLKKIREKVEPIVQAHQLNIVDVVWEKMGHKDVLNFSLANQDGTLDLDTAGLITGPLSEALDELDDLDFEYILDIGSPGAEKTLSSQEEMVSAMGEYVRVTLTSNESIEGTLKAVNQETVVLNYFVKGRPKTSTIAFNEIEKVQKAIKF